MENGLTVFEYEDKKVRTALDETGNPWFVATDIINLLDYKTKSSVNKLVGRVSEKRKGKKIILTLGGPQEFIVLTESGVWQFLATSNSPKAEPIQDWIFDEVLPAIRKNGFYSAVPAEPAINVDLRELKEELKEIKEFLRPKPPTAKPKMARFVIIDLVEQYRKNSGVEQREVWNKLYKEFKQRYNICPWSLKKSKNTSILNAVAVN